MQQYDAYHFCPNLKEFSTFFFFNFIGTLFIFGCVGSSVRARAFSSCGKQGLLFVAVHGLLMAVASLVAEHRLQARGLQQLCLAGSRAQAQQLWRTGLVAPQHVGSSRTRARTRVPCIGWRILNHCTTREARGTLSNPSHGPGQSCPDPSRSSTHSNQKPQSFQDSFSFKYFIRPCVKGCILTFQKIQVIMLQDGSIKDKENKAKKTPQKPVSPTTTNKYKQGQNYQLFPLDVLFPVSEWKE